MTVYEHLMERSDYFEEQCRESRDSYVKQFLAKTADHFRDVAMRLTVEEAVAPYNEKEWS